MGRKERADFRFEIDFCETILRRSPDDVDVLGMLASFYTRAGRVDDGLSLDLRLVALEPENPTAHYNLACSYALKERKVDAVAALREALRLGYDDFGWLRKDADLNALRDFPPFHDLLREFSAETR